MLLKISELRVKNLADLKEQLEQCSKNLLGLRFKKASGSLKDTSVFKKERRNIALIKTVITEQGVKI